ncbi:hypothetical protein EOPP23_01830 [Endozoicomonas sp. OPT23]|uniref:tetratricopeptide repeat protein n=1 Tax=Endozoicomonas sp. OPT23 TaxID=2072845 RepID=UPI00129B7AA7|nr:tetratricopeptide repeat protein [Endozoicomonas sp. OPT23]MRI31735.1 hypothetical protein [Endozoicomonas sp. OPT23]
MKRIIVTVGFSLFLAGCAGTGPQFAPEERAVTPEDTAISSPYEGRQDALGALMDQAVKALDSGELATASSWLSRAMRIEPTDPAIYYYLAKLRMEQGNLIEAKELAGRAMSLGPEQELRLKLIDFLGRLG